MAKAIAIAVARNPFVLALQSSLNFLRLIVDFMYGTPQRVKYTYVFAVGLAILGSLLSVSDLAASGVCSYGSLAN